MVDQPEYITVGEAMAELGVSKKTMARLLKEGALEATPDPVDRRIKRIKRADVLKLASTTAHRKGKEAA
jgi:excisionase family DNA binding protein